MKQNQKIQQVKQQAKRMSERMNKMGFAVSPRQALELVAAERGFVTWAAYEASLRKPEPKTPKWRKSDGPMSDEQYCKALEKEHVCPCCGSDQIEGEYVDIGLEFAEQQCGCLECGSEWYDYYRIHHYVLIGNGLESNNGTGEQDLASINAYTIAAYGEGHTFLEKGTAFGKDEDAAKEAFIRMRLGSRGNGAEFVIEFIGEVLATPEALVTWWKNNDLDEDELDEFVYEAVQEHGIPELNEQSSKDDQEAHLDDREKQASKINNEGIEAQLRYLLSVCELSILLTTLANDIGLEGTPPKA